VTIFLTMADKKPHEFDLFFTSIFYIISVAVIIVELLTFLNKDITMSNKFVGIVIVTLITFLIFTLAGCNPVKDSSKSDVCITDSCVEGINHDSSD